MSTSPIDSVMFWGDDPNIILDPKAVFELWPVEKMSFNQKLNAITRGIIVLCIIMFAIYHNGRLIAVCILTICAIYCMQRTVTRAPTPEPFVSITNVNTYIPTETSIPSLPVVFQTSTAENPFANVMPPDYDNAAAKLPAAPAYNASANADILNSMYSQINAATPSYPNISTDLFSDSYDHFGFEQSMRPFYSTASTTIPNDQGAFADFCYGATLSCLKDTAACVAGDSGACANRAQSCDSGNKFVQARV
jgi:hypothetical protein